MYLVPPIVSQIGDGENGGVMMNEFPSAFKQAWWDMAHHGGGKTGVVGVCGTEYLELIEAAGCQTEDFPTCQPVGQHQIWQRVSPDNCSTRSCRKCHSRIKANQPQFSHGWCFMD